MKELINSLYTYVFRKPGRYIEPLFAPTKFVIHPSAKRLSDDIAKIELSLIYYCRAFFVPYDFPKVNTVIATQLEIFPKTFIQLTTQYATRYGRTDIEFKVSSDVKINGVNFVLSAKTVKQIQREIRSAFVVGDAIKDEVNEYYTLASQYEAAKKIFS